MPGASTSSTELAERLRRASPDPTLALLFPGQGSHKVGAGKDLFDAYESARDVLQRAQEAVDFPLTRVCFEGPEEELRDTSRAQPAILAVSLACLAAALESGSLVGRPAFMAGHSLGEFSALVAAGALELAEAVSLVVRRGALMAEAGKRQPGTMIAVIGLNGEALDEVVRDSGIEMCNYNSPSQVVVGGSVAAVDEATRLIKERGGRALPLPVSGAFHTSLMADAAERFAEAVDACAVRDPAIPVVGNVSAAPLTTAEAVREELRAQIVRPVLWHQSVTRMVDGGATTFVETGPGRVLSGLIKRMEGELTALNLDTVESLEVVRDV